MNKKLLLITGGSAGIGLQTATLFADNHYDVINLSRRPIPLQTATQFSVDFSKDGWLERIADDLLKAIQGYDNITLVHNAALLQKGSATALNKDELQRSLDINVIAPALLNSLLIPSMRAGSSIIYIGSTLSEKAVANSAYYVIAKHAVVGMMRSTCQDLVGSGIHTTCVCPGFTDTEMLRAHVGEDEEILKQIASGVTQGRLVEPLEIANSIYFCANNPVLNGAVIHANLGQIEH
jgi:NAD(P)-dependent dehydrogenase (short-subunit alcohol dehydrogenase family)